MGHRARALGLAASLASAVAADAGAAERTPTIALGIDGSVPLTYGDDRFGNPAGRVDYLTSPYLRLSLEGKATPSLSYAFYTSGGFDKYPSRADGDSTFATLGASLSRRWDNGFRAGASLERNHAYDGIFGPFLYVAHDLGAYTSYVYQDVARLWRVKPAVSFSRRFSDDLSARSYVVSTKLDIERKVSEKVWLTFTPRVRHQHFLGGTNTGRDDTIYSVSAGMRYSINDNFGLTASMGYEKRTSNVDSKNFDSFGAGISLDFSHTFGSKRK